MEKRFIETTNAQFNVRKYKENVEFKNQQLLAEGENFSLNIVYAINEVPADIASSAFVKKSFSKKALEEKSNTPDGAIVKIKFGKFCNWYNKFGKQIDKPANEELDAKRYDVKVYFIERPADPNNSKAPRGFWATDIMIREVPANMFAGNAFEQAPAAVIPPVQAKLTNVTEVETSNDSEEPLPF